MIFHTINKCNLCDSGNLTPIWDFGNVPLANNLRVNSHDSDLEAPLRLVTCESCGCFQLKDLVNAEVLFSNYNYRSSLGLERHFKDYAGSAYRFLNLTPNALMVGIGGNTGLIESAFYDLGLKVVNVEPATNIARESAARGVLTINSFFDKGVCESIVKHFGRAKVVSANNVLAHCNLTPIMEGLDVLLDDNGFLVMENAYWPHNVRNRDIFQVYSEHFKYLSIKPLQQFFNTRGYSIVRVEFNNVQNGTFRAYVKRTANAFPEDETVMRAINDEAAMGLYDPTTYATLLNELNTNKQQLHNILSGFKNSGKRIGIFGVPAKLAFMLKFFNLAPFFDCATDDSDLKWNKYIPGTNIKIESPTDFWSKNLDVVFIGAYNFKGQILQRNTHFKGAWVNPSPSVEVISC